MKIYTEFKYRFSTVVVSADYIDNGFENIEFYSYRGGEFVEVPTNISNNFSSDDYINALTDELHNQQDITNQFGCESMFA